MSPRNNTKFKTNNNNNKRKTSFSGAREQTQCRFCRRGIDYVDYKDIETMSKLLTNRGKIYSRKRSGNCASCQRKAKRAIKRARFMALLPFTA
jgi:small subunit ribosomal protein S18